jgi:hypothetical protein
MSSAVCRKSSRDAERFRQGAESLGAAPKGFGATREPARGGERFRRDAESFCEAPKGFGEIPRVRKKRRKVSAGRQKKKNNIPY